MKLDVNKESVEMKTEIFQGDGFTIENGIIKGIEVIHSSSYNHLGEVIWETLSERPEHVAQIDALTGNKKTFKDIKERSIRLALWMKEQGIKPGDIITLFSSEYIDIDVIIFATLFVGAIYNAFPMDINLMTVRRFIKLIEPRMIFVCEEKLDTLQRAAELENHTCKIIILDDGGKDESLSDILNVHPSDGIDNFQITNDIKPENLFMIMPTSGTTGTSKFVCYSHGKILCNLPPSYVIKKASSRTDITLSDLAPEWINHLGCILLRTILKSTRIFSKNVDPYETFRIIDKYKVSKLIMHTYKVLIYCHADEDHSYNLDSVSMITASGFELPTKAMEKINKIFPNASVYKLLGSSEMSGITKYTEKCRNPQSQGTVIPNVQLKIIDVQSGLTLGSKKIGEICVKSPLAMTGYYKNPTETELAYDAEGWFHTGDQAYYDENGEIVFVGRLKDVIKYRDADVFPGSIERLLMSHPDILEVAVVGIPHDLYHEQPVACIKKVQGSKITDEDVTNLVISELLYRDTFKKWVTFVDEIPRTTNGKIKRRILKEYLENFYKSKK